MNSWTRAAARVLGNVLHVNIVRKGNAAVLLERDLLTRFLRDYQIDCVFDVGANAGQYALLLRHLGYKKAIISFEPIPDTARKLRKLAAKDKQWFVEEIALDEQCCERPFHIMTHEQFSSLRTPSNSDTGLFVEMNSVVSTVSVRTSRLDRFFDSYQSKLGFRRPFLKMDTQGNDISVARGAGDRLRSMVGLQSELAIKRIYDGQVNYRDAIDYYESLGFTLTGFVPNNLGHFPDLIEIDCIMYNPTMISNASQSS